jgi:hypothetical protein
MRTARPWLILCAAAALAGYGCASGGSTTASTPSNTPSTVSSGTGTTGTTGTGTTGTTGTGTTGTTGSTGSTGTTTSTSTSTTTANPVGSTPTTASPGSDTTSTGMPNSITTAGSSLALTESLSGLGLSSDQSSGAVGSVLSMAKGKLSAGDYGKVASAVPGASTYVQKAEAANGGPVTSLDSAYSKLGISPAVGAQVTPLIVNGISKLAGPTVGGLLSSVVK